MPTSTFTSRKLISVADLGPWHAARFDVRSGRMTRGRFGLPL